MINLHRDRDMSRAIVDMVIKGWDYIRGNTSVVEPSHEEQAIYNLILPWGGVEDRDVMMSTLRHFYEAVRVDHPDTPALWRRKLIERLRKSEYILVPYAVMEDIVFIYVCSYKKDSDS